MDMVSLETINLEDVGKYGGLSTYEKLWEDSALAHSIDTPHSFWVGLFLDAIIRRQEKAAELLGTMCGEFSVYQMWAEESIHSTNLRLADIEAQVVSHFTEWTDHVQAAMGQVKTTDISVKNFQQELIELTNSYIKHYDELGIIFNSFLPSNPSYISLSRLSPRALI